MLSILLSVALLILYRRNYCLYWRSYCVLAAVMAALLLLSFPGTGYCGRGQTLPSLIDLAQTVNRLSRSRGESRELAGCVKELLVAGRLQRATGKELSLVANSASALKTSAFSARGKEVLLRTADRVLSTPATVLQGWNLQNLSMLTCSLNTIRDRRVALVAIKTLAGELARRGAGFKAGEQWLVQSMVSLANTLSTVEGERARQAMQVLAQEVVYRQGRLRDKFGSSVIPLTIMANALSKVEGQWIAKALREIAGVVVPRGGELIDEKHWTDQKLALMANALGKTDGNRISRALRAIARFVARQPELRTWSGRNLSMMANGISKIAGDSYVNDALRAIAAAVARRSLESDTEWPAQSLAMLANGICKGQPEHVRRALEQIAEELQRRPLGNRKVWLARTLVMVSNGISKVEHSGAVSRALNSVARELIQRQAELESVAKWSERDLALIANAISKAEGESHIDQALSTLAEAAIHRGLGLKGRPRWAEGYLSMLAGAVSKARGDAIRSALRQVAEEVILQRAELKNDQLWSAQHLSTVTNAISKLPEDERVVQALNRIADAFASRGGRLADSRQWTAQSLTVMGNSLVKAEGKDIDRALYHLAKALVDRKSELMDQHSWMTLNLALTANALSRLQEDSFIKAQSLIAEVVVQRKDELSNKTRWPVKHLTIMSHGLSKTPTKAAHRALELIAATVCQDGPELRGDGWTAGELSKLASGMHLWSCTGAFELAVDNLLGFAESEPTGLAWLLSRMSSWHLLDTHLQGAARLFQALQRVDFDPGSSASGGKDACNSGFVQQLMWTATVMHFVSRQRSLEPDRDERSGTELAGLAALFADNYRRYQQQYDQQNQGFSSAGDQELIEHRGYTRQWLYDQWHLPFIRDYWQPVVTAPRKGKSRQAAVTGSHLQKAIFKALNDAFPGHSIEAEVPVNQFPVDIMLQPHICIEVDGPSHYVPCGRCPEASSSGCRQAKDCLVDHMLERYNYRVVRIPYTAKVGGKRFAAIIRHIRSLLADPESSSDLP